MGPTPVPPTTSDGVYQVPYVKPEKLPTLTALRYAFYDPRHNTIFGRTAQNWGGIVLFYIIFFAGVAALFSICMYGLLQSVSEDRPTYLLDSSIIGANPGLGFRPYSENLEHGGSLIWSSSTDKTNIEHWKATLDEFLREYEKGAKGADKRVICDGKPAPPGRSCDVPLDTFGPCQSNNSYSFAQSSPCVFIKLNRIFGWVPEYYNDTSDLPKEMPDDLRETIANEKDKNKVWIHCDGESVADREAVGPIAYFPNPGFPGIYYPYQNSPGYVSPLVAVHFKRPARNMVVNVECRAWAKNIRHRVERAQREGSVKFAIMVD